MSWNVAKGTPVISRPFEFHLFSYQSGPRFSPPYDWSYQKFNLPTVYVSHPHSRSFLFPSIAVLQATWFSFFLLLSILERVSSINQDQPLDNNSKVVNYLVSLIPLIGHSYSVQEWIRMNQWDSLGIVLVLFNWVNTQNVPYSLSIVIYYAAVDKTYLVKVFFWLIFSQRMVRMPRKLPKTAGRKWRSSSSLRGKCKPHTWPERGK